MEVLLLGVVFVFVVLLLLVLAAPALAVLFALALPFGAMVLLARLIRPGRAQPGVARTAAATLTGPHAGGVGVVSDRVRRKTPSPEYRSRPQGGLAPSFGHAPTLHRTANQRPAMASEFRSGEALFAFDRDLTIVSWNKGAAELTGIPVEEALGRPCWELLSGVDDRGDLVCHAGCPGARLASQGSQVKGQRLLIKTATGARRAAWLSTIAVRGGDEPLTLHLLRSAPEVADDNRSERDHQSSYAAPAQLHTERARPQQLGV